MSMWKVKLKYEFNMTPLIVVINMCFNNAVYGFPDPGQWSASYSKVQAAIFGTHKPLYAGSNIHVSVNCESQSSHQIELQWVIRQTSCYEDYLASDVYTPDILKQYFICPMTTSASTKIRFFTSKPVRFDCSKLIHLEDVNASFVTFDEKLNVPPDCKLSLYNPSPTELHKFSSIANMSSNFQGNNSLIMEDKNHGTDKGIFLQEQSRNKRAAVEINSARFINDNLSIFHVNSNGYFFGASSYPSKLGPKLTSVDLDGVYLFILKIESVDQTSFNATVDVAMKGDHGYLSAIDYPLLIFYGVMCGLYVIYAIVWLILSALQWRDLLRIQFWIGAVILLGLMEKAVFYAEYQSINYTGQSVQGAILFAEILSSMKRTLARMLIIIVSLGFGIVKPRLGPTLHHIVGVGFVYFTFSTIEGSLRVLKPKTDPGNQALMAGIPLAVTDSIICWWIFSSLVQTVRTLRLRRNIVKLQLYRHFTNTLLLSVIGSAAFMIWSIHAHKLVSCVDDWKELWVDEAYWHFLFSLILFVIMILWRPTNNNQRYAFTPLLDAIDDDEDDEDNLVANDGFVGMKMRSTKSLNNSPNHNEPKSNLDEDLKWVEENIPPSLTDVALPSLLDSDEEIMTTKFERSKME
ncbi:transmembrane protein 87A isoform X2 [Parasteatoda tepidariorum]|uniref:transmembrane protein 87A isoform X2 n=1 Tax=Parasteatoda tepidariorum TaxID=114398 RepID=UPI001C71EC12|nr:transmembrane protein 87A isoform X2 [Parasteatoda tepidariorum]